MKKLAFTLTEVLVVCAILAIVAAIAFPVFQKTKEKSLETVSISNMRQLYLAIEIYRSEWSGSLYGTQEAMGLPDAPTEKYLGPSVRGLRPPLKKRGSLYYYYPIPAQIDRRRPSWEEYSQLKQGQTVLLADAWFNPQDGTPPYRDYIMDPNTSKYLIGITLDGNVRRKRAAGNLSLDWWDR